jgi:hypothetical protein
MPTARRFDARVSSPMERGREGSTGRPQKADGNRLDRDRQLAAPFQSMVKLGADEVIE